MGAVRVRILVKLCYFGLILPLSSSMAFAEVTKPAPKPSKPIFVTRGEPVESAYDAYVERLKNYYVKLKAVLAEKDPEELKLLDPEPPKPVVVGYQLIPKVILEDLYKKPPEQKFTTSKFSWVITENSIKYDQGKLKEYEDQLATLTNFKGLANKYQDLNRKQKIWGSQVNYLKFWQDQIYKSRARYDQSTKIYQDLMSKKMSPSDAVEYRLKELMGEPPPFLKFKVGPNGENLIEVDLITDIVDENFIKQFKEAIVKYWRIPPEWKVVGNPSDYYSVEVNIERISPDKLYEGHNVPGKGDKIDIAKHISRFGTDRGIVTTGDKTTYYAQYNGRHYLVMGSTDTTDTVLAHEFGHILMLNDAYFRGYHDIGEHGYEVLEVIPDMTDIMCAPGVGRVKKHHFELVINSIKKRDLPKPMPIEPMLDRRPAGVEDH